MMKVILRMVIFIVFSSAAFGQNVSNDLTIIEKTENVSFLNDNNSRSTSNLNDKKPIRFHHRSFISRYNPFSLVAKWTMLFYQNVASPELFRSCLFERSCSNFSKKAIEEFGLIKGVFLSADRLLRCNTFAVRDFPPKTICPDGLLMDEPSKYRLKSRK